MDTIDIQTVNNDSSLVTTINANFNALSDSIKNATTKLDYLDIIKVVESVGYNLTWTGETDRAKVNAALEASWNNLNAYSSFIYEGPIPDTDQGTPCFKWQNNGITYPLTQGDIILKTSNSSLVRVPSQKSMFFIPYYTVTTVNNVEVKGTNLYYDVLSDIPTNGTSGDKRYLGILNSDNSSNFMELKGEQGSSIYNNYLSYATLTTGTNPSTTISNVTDTYFPFIRFYLKGQEVISDNWYTYTYASGTGTIKWAVPKTIGAITALVR